MTVILVVFGIVYLGMMLGKFPKLKLDRTAIALVGVIVLLASETVAHDAAVSYVGFRTIELLFGLMLVSTQLNMSGLYSEVTRRVVRMNVSPRALLAVLVLASGFLSALLSNDVVALAMAPVLLDMCIQRKLNPVPFLLGMACGTNAGSVATIIGSPQNMLIGEQLDLSFLGFMGYTALPSVLAMVAVWAVIAFLYRGRWELDPNIKLKGKHHKERKLDRLESIKGVIITGAVIALFIVTDWPRALIALGAGGVLLFNGHYKSRKMLDRVDWQLLVLFVGLFVVNGALEATGLPERMVNDLATRGFNLVNPVALFVSTAVLSDLVSNVPAVMLVLPFADQPLAGPIMALSAGLSSNLIIVGSIANIIVVDAAGRRGIKISFAEHAKTGVPITIVSLLIAAGWLWLLSAVL